MCTDCFASFRLQKRTFLSGEQLKKMDIYHFGKDVLKKEKLNWSLIDEDGKIISKGTLDNKNIQPYTVDSLGTIDIDLDGITHACQLTLKAGMGGVKMNGIFGYIRNKRKNKRILSIHVNGMKKL